MVTWTRVVASAAVAAAAACSDPIPDSPTFAEVHAIADEACPSVTIGFLYRAEKDGQTAYILGTRHAGITMAKLPPYVVSHFHAAHTVVFESVDQPPLAATTAGPTLEDRLGDEDWDKFRRLVGKDAADRAAQLSIFAATAAVYLLFEDVSEAVDRELLTSARAAKQELVGLEDAAQNQTTAETLLGIDVLRSSLHVIKRRAQLSAFTREDLAGYCKGDYNVERASTNPTVARAIESTAERTAAWIPRLDALFAHSGVGGVFVVVGSAHLVGPRGLVEQLRARGYHVVHATD